MDRVFQKIIANNFSDLKGAMVDASIPVSEALINELIRTGLKGNENIESVAASVHAQNRMSVNVKTTLLPLALNLKLRLDTSVDLESYGSPKIRAWLENNRLLGSLGNMFKAFPPEVRLYNDQLVIDLGAFLRSPEQKRLLELVRFVGIKTQEGILVLDVRLAVDS